MLDFSFLHNGDFIAVDNMFELDFILAEFEEFGICWSSGHRATQLPDNPRKPIRYVRFFKVSESGFITYGTGEPEWSSPMYKVYKASELLQLRYSDSTDSDFEPLSESDLKEFLSV